MWDSETGQCASSHNGGDGADLGLLLSLDVVHPSSQTWLTGSTAAGGAQRRGEGRLALWDLRAKEGVVAAVTLPCGLVPSVSYSPYQQGIAAGGSDGVVRLFDTRKLSLERSHTVPVPHTAPALRQLSAASQGRRAAGAGLPLPPPRWPPPLPSRP